MPLPPPHPPGRKRTKLLVLAVITPRPPRITPRLSDTRHLITTSLLGHPVTIIEAAGNITPEVAGAGVAAVTIGAVEAAAINIAIANLGKVLWRWR